MHFLSMELSDIIAITNSNDESASPGKIPPWIFASAKVFSFCSQFHFPVLYGFCDELYDFVGYLVHFKQSVIQHREAIWYSFLLSIHAMSTFSRFVWLSLNMCWLVYSRSPAPLVPWRHFFCSLGKSPQLTSELKISFLIYTVRLFHFIGRYDIGL